MPSPAPTDKKNKKKLPTAAAQAAQPLAGAPFAAVLHHGAGSRHARASRPQPALSPGRLRLQATALASCSAEVVGDGEDAVAAEVGGEHEEPAAGEPGSHGGEALASHPPNR